MAEWRREPGLWNVRHKLSLGVNLLKEASLQWERTRCHRGTSTSSRGTQSGLAADSASRAMQQISVTINLDCSKEPMQATGACREALLILSPPQELGRDAFSQAKSDKWPTSKVLQTSCNKSFKELVACSIHSGEQECKAKDILVILRMHLAGCIRRDLLNK